jgi:polyhydroxybutyrate depolymerase
MEPTDGDLEHGTIEVAGMRRTYWLARAARRPGSQTRSQAAAPLLIVLHGSGMDGRSMARFTGLAGRAHAAGITTVFPDGWKGFWHQLRPPDRQPNLDDARFLAELSVHLEGQGVAQSWPVYLAGISNGARFAEHVARHGQLAVAGLFVVVGSALEVSRRVAPVPTQRSTVVMIMGTGDRTTPYDGGPLIRHGLTGLVRKRRAVRHAERPGEDVIAAAETVASDWASGNGISSAPAVEELPAQPGDPPVTRMTWTAPGCHPVTLYRVDGGGHGWPGGPQYLPARVVGPIPRHLDATGMLLEMAEWGGAADDRILGPSGSG